MKRLLGVLIIFGAVISGLLNAPSASAASEWSWTDSQPVTVSNDEAPFNESKWYCPTYEQSFPVDGEAEQLMCMYEGGALRMGFLFGGTYVRVAVAYPFESTFHIVEGLCGGVPNCRYSSAQDTLVTPYFTSSINLSSMVFKHFSQRITPTTDPITGVVHYRFNGGTPDYLLSDQTGRPVSTGSLAFSRNGKWLVAEATNLGLVLVNMDTFQARRITAQGLQYGYAHDPLEELAVSDDGREVAVTGRNAGFGLIVVTPQCGESLVPLMQYNFQPGVQLCVYAPIDITRFITRFWHGARPEFDAGGGQLSLYLASWEVPPQRVVLRASGYAALTKLDYLALGDSFSSGEGETDGAQYLKGTDEPYEKCHVSQRSYPFLLAQALFIPVAGFRSVACSGAKTGDVLERSAFYWGQQGRLGAKKRGLSEAGALSEQAKAVETFLPGRVPQETFVRQAQPTLLTVGLGGNDAGLMEKLKTCAMPGTCEWVQSQEALYKTGVEIRELFDKLVSMYQRLRADSPLSKLFAVGYPKIIKPDGVCDPITGLLLNEKERHFMDEGIQYINQVIRAAAVRAGALYLDIEQSLIGHRLCEGGLSSTAVNGLRGGDEIAPVSALPMLKLIGNETFHPAPLGHELIAEAITQLHPHLLAELACLGCVSAERPTPSDYWKAEDVSPITEQQRAEDFVDDVHISSASPIVYFAASEGSFAPNSQVRAELHSETSVLGIFTSDAKGGLRDEVKLPRGLEEGYHTIHLYGETPSGRAVDIYEVVSYGDPPSAVVTKLGGKECCIEETPRGLNKAQPGNVLGVNIGKSMLLSGPALAVGSSRLAGTIHNHLIVFVLIAGAVLLGLVGMLFIWRWRRRQKNLSRDRGG